MALIALYLGWKYAYFGDILPAPYYAKAGQFEPWMGLVRASLFFLMWTTMGLAVLFAVHVGQTLLGWRRAPAHLWLHLAMVAVTVAYPVSLGYRVAMDDAFRLFVPVVPLLGLSAFHALRRVLPLYGERVRIVVVPTVVALVGATAVTLHEFKTYDINWGALPHTLSMKDAAEVLVVHTRAAADWIRTNTCKDDVIVLHNAGMIPYFSDRRIIDIFSLADPAILKMNYDVRQGTIDLGEGRRRFQEYLGSLRYDIILQEKGLIFGTPLAEGFEYKGIQFAIRPGELLVGPERSGLYEIWARTDRSFPCTQTGG